MWTLLPSVTGTQARLALRLRGSKGRFLDLRREARESLVSGTKPTFTSRSPMSGFGKPFNKRSFLPVTKTYE